MTVFNRRDLLTSALATGVALPAVANARGAGSRPWTEDATTLASRIRRGDISRTEAVDHAISISEALQPKLNFLVTDDFERARDKARRGYQTGPFAGVPFLIKDLTDYRGLPTRRGSRTSAGDGPITQQPPYIDALDRAGFIVIGKSSAPEYGLLPTTEPAGFAPTCNPWNPTRSSGGSSGGSAAAVAAGVVPIAHANDGGGSIRIPAAVCGLFGLKPSQGRMIGATLEEGAGINIGVEHCVSHSVRDSAALFAASERSDADAPYPPVGFVSGPSRKRLRIGLLLEGHSGFQPDRDVATAVASTGAMLRKLGHTVTPTRWPFDSARFADDISTFWCSLGTGVVASMNGDKAKIAQLEQFTLSLADTAARMPAGRMEAAIAGLKAIREPYARWLEKFDVIMSPVLSSPAVPLGQVAGNHDFQPFIGELLRYCGYTVVHNIVRAPAMSLPLHMSVSGLPIAVQFAAAVGAERTLLHLAYELEAGTPWAHRRPPIHAASL